MAEIADLLPLDAGNTGRFPEGQSIPSLNDGARALEGMIARAHRDRSGYTASSGSGAAYQILTQSAYPAHTVGMVFQWRAHVASANGPSLKINDLPVKPLLRQGGGLIVASDIAVNQQVLAAYNPTFDSYECIGIGDGSPSAPSYTVSTLPAGSAGKLAFANNGRKNGQAAAAGTGVLVVHDGANWCAVDTMAVVQA
jgi:hypothetical protein